MRLGTGDGDFSARVGYVTESFPTYVLFSDLNGDQAPDMLVVNAYANSVSVRFGAGVGTFGSKVDYPTGLGPTMAAVGDLNGDTISNLVVTNSTSGSMIIFLGASPK